MQRNNEIYILIFEIQQVIAKYSKIKVINQTHYILR